MCAYAGVQDSSWFFRMTIGRDITGMYFRTFSWTSERVETWVK